MQVNCQWVTWRWSFEHAGNVLNPCTRCPLHLWHFLSGFQLSGLVRPKCALKREVRGSTSTSPLSKRDINLEKDECAWKTCTKWLQSPVTVHWHASPLHHWHRNIDYNIATNDATAGNCYCSCNINPLNEGPAESSPPPNYPPPPPKMWLPAIQKTATITNLDINNLFG